MNRDSSLCVVTFLAYTICVFLKHKTHKGLILYLVQSGTKQCQVARFSHPALTLFTKVNALAGPMKVFVLKSGVVRCIIGALLS